MSSIGVVVFRNSPLKSQVLQETVNNSVNITNNENVRREIIIVRKKPKIQSPNTVSVSSLVHSLDGNTSSLAKRPKYRETAPEEVSRNPTPIAVARRNARERNRVRQVNDGFAALRRHIPEEVAAEFENANSNRGPNKKLSKVETLRMAVEYIRNLESLLNIGHADKENYSRPSMESFPSPASSSPRENSQERSYFSMNSPAVDEDDVEEDEQGCTINQISAHHYIDMPVSDGLHLVPTPRLYDEDDGQPMTPSSDLLHQEEINHHHLLESHFQFPNAAEHFTVIPEQNYCTDPKVAMSDSEFEAKYVDTIHQRIQTTYEEESALQLDCINPDLILNHNEYKFKEEVPYLEEERYHDVELKKEIPEIQVTPEDREQFEETLKWWQEKTRQAFLISKNKKS
ncbi:unnamed protein product [Leptidea sinapis]|uniref:BHLH domain-containing protein n=1 Tax=Leptidea sinapis TaxID=189913 RepID=A0A5E4Q3J2_9NEOP|nr:unnamed protein product [Leptidea sinapis]